MSGKDSRGQVREFHAALISASPDDLDPAIMQKWIDEPMGLKLFLKGLAARSLKGWEVFKEIWIGEMTAKEYLQELDKASLPVTGYARSIAFKAIRANTRRHRVSLVWIPLSELNFTIEPTWNEIVLRAREVGLEPCAPEVALVFHRNFYDHETREKIWVVMDPVPLDGNTFVFTLERQDGILWLGESRVNMESRFELSHEFIFVRKQK